MSTESELLNSPAVSRHNSDGLDCITQDPQEGALGPDYLTVCTVRADMVAISGNCVGTGCGGHPICRPCYDRAVEHGLVASP